MLVAYHVQKTLEGETGLWRTVTPESATCWFVRHYSSTGILVVGYLVQRRDHAARIVNGDDAERCIGPAVQYYFTLESGDPAVLLYPQLHVDVLLVPSPVVQEHLLPGVDHFHRASRSLR